MSIDLSPELEQIIRRRLKSGGYSTESDVVREALVLLERRDEIRDQVNLGIEQLDNGQFSEYGENDLDKFLADIAAEEARIFGTPHASI